MNTQQDTMNTEEQQNDSSVEGKDIAIISYLTIIGLIIAFIMNREKQHEFARFHIQQVLGLALVSLVIFIVGQIPILGWIVSFLLVIPMLILWVMGLMNAINGKKKELPLIGSFASETFKNI